MSDSQYTPYVPSTIQNQILAEKIRLRTILCESLLATFRLMRRLLEEENHEPTPGIEDGCADVILLYDDICNGKILFRATELWQQKIIVKHVEQFALAMMKRRSARIEQQKVEVWLSACYFLADQRMANCPEVKTIIVNAMNALKITKLDSLPPVD